MIITIATFCHLAKYGAKCLPVLAHLILTMSQWGNNYPQLTKEESGLGEILLLTQVILERGRFRTCAQAC